MPSSRKIIGSSSITPEGAIGPAGATGASLTGPDGASGATGATGATGASGAYISGGFSFLNFLNVGLSDAPLGKYIELFGLIGPTGSTGTPAGSNIDGVALFKEVSDGLTFWFKGISAEGSLSLYTSENSIGISGDIGYQGATFSEPSLKTNKFAFIADKHVVSSSGLTFDVGGTGGILFDNSITLDVEENIINIPELNVNDFVGITGAPCIDGCPGGTAGGGVGIQLEVHRGSVIKVATPMGIKGFTGDFVDSELFGFTMILEGNYLWDWPTNVKFIKGNDFFSCGEDIINFITDDGGVTWNATVAAVGFGVSSNECSGVETLGSCCYVDDYNKRQCVEYITQQACNEIYNQSRWSYMSPCSENCGATAEGICCSHGGNWGNFSGTGVCVEGLGVAECNYFGGSFWEYYYYDYVDGILIELETPNPITCPLVGNVCPSPCELSACCKGGVCLGDSIGSTSLGAISPHICSLVLGGQIVDGGVCGEIDCCNYVTVLGACCYPDIQQCVFQDGYTCSSSGGVFMGPGTDCTEDVCCFFDEVGVCCLNQDACDCCGGVIKGACQCTQGCSLQTREECEQNAAYCHYLGDNTVCVSDIEGCCCYQEDGEVWTADDNISLSQCAQFSGVLFPDESCSSVDCETDAYGACCLDDTTLEGDCAEGISYQTCQEYLGVFMGGRSSCSDADVFCGMTPCLCHDGCFQSSIYGPPMVENYHRPCPDYCVSLDPNIYPECPAPAEIWGACCEHDGTGYQCTDVTSMENCQEDYDMFFPNRNCTQIDCTVDGLGACCMSGSLGTDCTNDVIHTAYDCSQRQNTPCQGGCDWGGPGTDCDDISFELGWCAGYQGTPDTECPWNCDYAPLPLTGGGDDSRETPRAPDPAGACCCGGGMGELPEEEYCYSGSERQWCCRGLSNNTSPCRLTHCHGVECPQVSDPTDGIMCACETNTDHTASGCEFYPNEYCFGTSFICPISGGLGACCHGDGTCDEVAEEDCQNNNWSFLGVGSVCGENNASCLVEGGCCYSGLGDQTCQNMSWYDCLQMNNSMYLGQGNNCEDACADNPCGHVIGPCCYDCPAPPFNGCNMLTKSCCASESTAQCPTYWRQTPTNDQTCDGQCTGACCNTVTGECSPTTMFACSGDFLRWDGLDKVCCLSGACDGDDDGLLCTALDTESCCDPIWDVCYEDLAQNCSTAGNNPGGPGTSCGNPPCDDVPRGACCANVQDCDWGGCIDGWQCNDYWLEAQCLDQIGNCDGHGCWYDHSDNDNACENVDCVVTGVCCKDGVCIETTEHMCCFLSEPGCLAQYGDPGSGGVYQGDNTTCDGDNLESDDFPDGFLCSRGCCCQNESANDPGACLQGDTYENACYQFFPDPPYSNWIGHQWSGGQLVSPCCDADGCSSLDLECSCTETGPCCKADNYCEMMTAYECAGLDQPGVFRKDGAINCESPGLCEGVYDRIGVCCSGSGAGCNNCESGVTESYCQDTSDCANQWGYFWEGVDRVCEPNHLNPCLSQNTGPCCYSGGCVNATEYECLYHYFGVLSGGSSCADSTVDCSRQACCLPDNGCSYVSKAECFAIDGQPQGEASQCWNVSCGGKCRNVDMYFMINNHWSMAGVTGWHNWNSDGTHHSSSDLMGENHPDYACAFQDPGIDFYNTDLRHAQQAVQSVIQSSRPTDKIGMQTMYYGNPQGCTGGGLDDHDCCQRSNSDPDPAEYSCWNKPYEHLLCCGGASTDIACEEDNASGVCTVNEVCRQCDESPLHGYCCNKYNCGCHSMCNYVGLTFNHARVEYEIFNIGPTLSHNFGWMTGPLNEFQSDRARPSETTSRVLVYVTNEFDGEWQLSNFHPAIYKEEEGVEVYTVGVGGNIGNGVPYGMPHPNTMVDWDDAEGRGWAVWDEPGTQDVPLECLDDESCSWWEDEGGCCPGHGDSLFHHGVTGECPWTDWCQYADGCAPNMNTKDHPHNCAGYWLRIIASDPHHFHNIGITGPEAAAVIRDQIGTIYSGYCDTGVHCCKNLNQTDCSSIGGHWKEGYCQNEGELCQNYGTRTCGTSPLCGDDHYVGACCIVGAYDSTCISDMTVSGCDGLGGDFRGVGSICEEEDCGGVGYHEQGACCEINSNAPPTCSLKYRDQCILQGHLWNGSLSCEGVFCCAEPGDMNVGGCCSWDGAYFQCVDTPRCLCAQTDGAENWSTGLCSETNNCENTYIGSCCFPEYAGGAYCDYMTITQCNTSDGGVWKGINNCDEVCCETSELGLCCLEGHPTPICESDITKCSCIDLGGAWLRDLTGDGCNWDSCTAALNGISVPTYVTLTDGTCGWVMCVPGSCPYPDCPGGT